MAKKNALKIEYLIILVSLFLLLMWAVSQCGKQRNKVLQEKAAETGPGDTSALSDLYGDLQGNGNTPQQPVNSTTAPGKTNNTQTTAPTPQNSPPAGNAAGNSTRLFIVMDGVNLRDAPRLNAAIVAKLPLFEEVYFLNEITDTTQQLSIGKEVADEPWVKVRTQRGREGWVYGAYVSYYKKKRKGGI